MFDQMTKTIFDNAMELIIAFDEGGKIIYANALAKHQLDYDEMIYETTIEDLFPGSFRTDGTKIETSWKFGHEAKEVSAYRRNRTCFTVLARIIKCQDESVYYLCLAKDISEKIMLEKKVIKTRQEAEAALKVKSEFVSNITHELKTPVNGILGNTRELINLESQADKQRLLHLVERGCNDMMVIIGNVLDFSKLEAGKFILEPREFNFRGMIDYVRSTHIHKIAEKGLEFFVNISPDIPETVIGDELRLAQILNNLLSNATKFTHVGKIMMEVVKTAQFQDQIELFFFVIDSGIGIAQEDQDKLFQSFSQVDASITRQYGGSGLGLNICKQLVEMMDGDISVESERGKGSVFSFHVWLKLPEEEAGVMTQNADAQEILHNLKGMVDGSEDGKIWKFGTEENLSEIRKKMSKLILCMEMENWEKAEMFAETVKHLTDTAPQEIRTMTLRLKMAVQKEDYKKAVDAFEGLQKLL
ncbi:MAG: hypothetical protein K6G30_11185 [Acetatifactor sp.]|nr:hypothetical protein [Acetatifactor sp.]